MGRFWNALAVRPLEIFGVTSFVTAVGSNRWAGQIAAFLQGIEYATGPPTAVALDEHRVLECLHITGVFGRVFTHVPAQRLPLSA